MSTHVDTSSSPGKKDPPTISNNDTIPVLVLTPPIAEIPSIKEVPQIIPILTLNNTMAHTPYISSCGSDQSVFSERTANSCTTMPTSNTSSRYNPDPLINNCPPLTSTPQPNLLKEPPKLIPPAMTQNLNRYTNCHCQRQLRLDPVTISRNLMTMTLTQMNRGHQQPQLQHRFDDSVPQS